MLYLLADAATSWEHWFNYGVPTAILVALGLGVWRLSVRILRWSFGDETKNPPTEGYLTRKMESSESRDKKMVQFIESMEVTNAEMKEHRETQQRFCAQHVESLGAICDAVVHNKSIMDDQVHVLCKHGESLKELLEQHTDASIPRSTAEAIEVIHALRDAVLQTCLMGKELANVDSDSIAETVRSHCGLIETMLNSNLKEESGHP